MNRSPPPASVARRRAVWQSLRRHVVVQHDVDVPRTPPSSVASWAAGRGGARRRGVGEACVSRCRSRDTGRPPSGGRRSGTRGPRRQTAGKARHEHPVEQLARRLVEPGLSFPPACVRRRQEGEPGGASLSTNREPLTDSGLTALRAAACGSVCRAWGQRSHWRVAGSSGVVRAVASDRHVVVSCRGQSWFKIWPWAASFTLMPPCAAKWVGLLREHGRHVVRGRSRGAPGSHRPSKYVTA